MAVDIAVRAINACLLDALLYGKCDPKTESQASALGHLVAALTDMRWRETCYVDDKLVFKGDLLVATPIECNRIANLASKAGLDDMAESWTGLTDGTLLVVEVLRRIPSRQFKLSLLYFS